jgi:hypothetical protein
MGNRRPSVSDVSDIYRYSNCWRSIRSRDSRAQITWQLSADLIWQLGANHVTAVRRSRDNRAHHMTVGRRSRDSWVQITWQPKTITRDWSRDRHADWPSVARGVAAGPAALHSPARPGGQSRSPDSRSGYFFIVKPVPVRTGTYCPTG